MDHKDSRDEDREGSDMLKGSTKLSAGGSASGGLEVTHQIVTRAETKLVGLHANRSQLRRRIRALHYLLKALETVSSPFDCPHPGLDRAAQKSTVSHDESNQRSSDPAVTSRAGSKELMTGTPVVTGISTELRRACRIALMESDRPQTCEQVLQRIRRRGSVCVEGFHDPMIAIAQELRKMLADGEVIQKKDSHLWQLNRDSVRVAGERNAARK